MSRPSHLYKYQSVLKETNPETDRSIKNLINHTAVFSTRRNFNDLFDSKIFFDHPQPSQLDAIRSRLEGAKRIFIDQSISSGKITSAGETFFRQMQKKYDELLDSYLFYCLSAKNNSNLMWSHYANSHRGFCIEFDAAYMQADPVKYADHLPRIDLFNAWAFPGAEQDEQNIGNVIWDCLRVKLREWQYEEEYRFHLGNQPKGSNVSKDDRYLLVEYDPAWVTSIIFGCRTSEKVKEYIKHNLPYEAQFKQATPGDGVINIS